MFTGAVVRSRRRGLTPAELGVYVLDETNNIGVGERILIEPFAVFAVYVSSIERTDALSALSNSALIGSIAYEQNTSTFWKLVALNNWEAYTPVPPDAGGGGGGLVAVTGVAVHIVAPVNDVTQVRLLITGGAAVTVAFTGDATATVAGFAPGSVQVFSAAFLRADGTVSATYSATATIPAMAPTAIVAGSITVAPDSTVAATGVLSAPKLLVPPGLSVGVAFDGSRPLIATFAAYWNGHADTATFHSAWDGSGSLAVTLPYPASMVAGQQTLILAGDNAAGDNVLLSFISVNVADIAIAVSGGIAFAESHEPVGTTGVFLGINGNTTTWIIDKTERFAVSYYGDLDAEAAIRGITGSLKMQIDYDGKTAVATWIDRSQGVILNLPDMAPGVSIPCVIKMLADTGGGPAPIAQFPDRGGSILPSPNATGGGYRGGTIQYVKSGGAFGAVLSGDIA